MFDWLTFDWLNFDWLSADLLYICMAILLVIVNAVLWSSNALTLPGNWMMVVATALFMWLAPTETENGLSWWIVGGTVVLAGLGELIEFLAGAAGAANQGASRRAMFLAVVGTMVGSLMGATAGIPIPVLGLAIGAIAGGTLGAFAGAWIGEAWKGKTAQEAMNVSKAAMIGRLLGTLGKLLCGALIFMLVFIDLIF